MHDELAGQVAIVTGAGRGIGRATVHALAEAGAGVAVVDIDGAASAATAAALRAGGHDALESVADVSTRSSVGGDGRCGAEPVAPNRHLDQQCRHQR